MVKTVLGPSISIDKFYSPCSRTEHRRSNIVDIVIIMQERRQLSESGEAIFFVTKPIGH